MPNALAAAEILDHLRAQLAGPEFAGDERQPATASGWPALDRLLPRGGVAPGTLIELLEEPGPSGTAMLAAGLTRAVRTTRPAVVLLDRAKQFYPPGLAAWGVPGERMIVVHPKDETDELWAAVQALRCRAVAAVWLRRDRLTPADFRRLQLAARTGQTLGLLLRPAKVRGQPTWADVQLLVSPRPGTHGRRLHVELTRGRGIAAGKTCELELDERTGTTLTNTHETLRMPVSAALAGAVHHRSAAGSA